MHINYFNDILFGIISKMAFKTIECKYQFTQLLFYLIGPSLFSSLYNGVCDYFYDYEMSYINDLITHNIHIKALKRFQRLFIK